MFTADTGSNTLPGCRVFPGKGVLKLVRKIAAQESEGSGPLDLDITSDGRFLYVLNAVAGTVGAFQITFWGTLVPLGDVDGSLAIYAQGMVAR